MNTKQQKLREECKFLKWMKGIKYYEIARAINMSEHGFYNFMNNKEIDLGYTNQKKLEEFIKENRQHE